MLVIALLTEDFLRGGAKTVVHQRCVGLVEGDAALADSPGEVCLFGARDVATVHAAVAQVHIAGNREIAAGNRG